MINHHLAIEVSEKHIRFTSFRNEEILKQLSISVSTNEESIAINKLNECFAENSFLSEDFKDISLSYASKESSLVPNQIFVDATPQSIFKLCFGEKKDGNSIDFNRLAELSIVNIYQIPDWIKRYFVMKFPRIILQHEGTHALRKVLNDASFSLKINLFFHEDFFYMTIVKHSNLEFYSFFDYQNDDDILYHVLFALQQKELINEKGSIELISKINAEANCFESLKNNFKRIKELKLLTISEKNNFIAQSQLLCV